LAQEKPVFVKAFVNFASVKKLRLDVGLTAFPIYTTKKGYATEKVDSTFKDTPPPTSFFSRVELMPEKITGKEIEDSQHLFNTHSTTIQQPLNVELVENAQTVDDERDVEPQEFIQHTTRDEGARGCVEQSQFDGVLQTEPPRNSSSTCSTIIETPSHSKPLNPIFTSQQQAFTEKYQPVEVLNSDGEWVSGYYVHKCLFVENLEGIEGKYALVDELRG
jgi:hypothetical protein